jgi:SHS2 domain-containing protein
MIKLMKKYEVLEHKADFKIRVFGKNKPELFLNALLGMVFGLRPELGAASAKREIKIKSPDLNTLLVDFLSEVLYLAQVNREVYDNVKFIKFTDTEIEAELFGQKVKRFGEDIKAVTHHDLDIHQRADGNWEAVLLFDI